jgi:hypothetical protein
MWDADFALHWDSASSHRHTGAWRKEELSSAEQTKGVKRRCLSRHASKLFRFFSFSCCDSSTLAGWVRFAMGFGVSSISDPCIQHSFGASCHQNPLIRRSPATFVLAVLLFLRILLQVILLQFEPILLQLVSASGCSSASST